MARLGRASSFGPLYVTKLLPSDVRIRSASSVLTKSRAGWREVLIRLHDRRLKLHTPLRKLRRERRHVVHSVFLLNFVVHWS